MQTDMHYYGTYAMARAAGLSAEAAQIIATAAEYVDENVARTPIVLKDGARILRRPTAHHLRDIKNLDENDQREIWVPFHFLPGDEIDPGENDDYTLRLRCRKNSEIARRMVDHLIESQDVVALERCGIVAHVYADTFAHYGFSGVSSRRNRVDGEAFEFEHTEDTVRDMHTLGKAFFSKFRAQGGEFDNIKPWLRAIEQRIDTIKGTIAEELSGALGHGPVASFPDQPYLRWSYTYEYPRRETIRRNNPADFLEACESLHTMFRRFGEARNDFQGDKGQDFTAIRETVREILDVVGDKKQRSLAWQDAARKGRLFRSAEEIPAYDGPAWTTWLENAGAMDSTTAIAHPACRFHLAAHAHRSWVLHDLLPSRNLLVA